MNQRQTLRALHKHILSRRQCLLIGSSGKLLVVARQRMTTTTTAPALPTPIHDGLGNGTPHEEYSQARQSVLTSCPWTRNHNGPQLHARIWCWDAKCTSCVYELGQAITKGQ
ncbi:hypothetical protein LB505_009757 [Fusarium chuoi]|nr:hypothetical protein LB505_009757 [Fusarium chuoi]